MYARYIPPSKGSTATQPAVASPEPAPVRVTTVDAGGSTYGRFIPASKKVTEPSPSHSIIKRFDDDSKRTRDANEEAPGSTLNRSRNITQENLDGSTKEPKKKRKRKSRTAGSDSEDDKPERSAPVEDTPLFKARVKESAEAAAKHEPVVVSEKDDKDVDMLDAAGIGQPNNKKPKKEKKKKAGEGQRENSNRDQDDEEDMRHKSVLERRARSLKLAGQTAKSTVEESDEEETEFHGLEPLPQPEDAPIYETQPSYETLPSWLAAPIRVEQDTRKPFSELGLLPKAARVLQEKGYPDAFAVQTATIPLLLSSSQHQPGDVLISAATGSGKTLAYALPVVKDISQGLVTRLRALVVLPTRELVKQAQDAFELCAKAYEGSGRKRVRVGVSIGSQTLRSEQEALVESESRYDPQVYRDLQARSADDSLEADVRPGSTQLAQWEGQVVEYHSKVDVLICTPGRLVEHLEQTPGFNLDYVRWLVVDEADKLLAQSFQGWLDIVMESFRSSKDTARDFPDMNLSGVRKVILSATLTRDLSLLAPLRLRRPQLIVLESSEGVQLAEHTLPATLSEYAIRVHNDNLKPLYLHELLTGHHMAQKNLDAADAIANHKAKPTLDNASDTSSSESDTSSGSSSSSDADSSSASDSDDSLASMKSYMVQNYYPQSLIFTKSNESALRLSRLLGLLDNVRSSQISTLTSTTPSHVRRKTLKSFSKPSSPIRLVIASDLVARGIDIPDLANVINYDLPPSVAGYVHRVGRTARAGKAGRAWTLVGDAESGWFWGKIAKASGVKRPQKVARILIEERTEAEVARYEKALEKLGQEAIEARKR